MKSLAPWRHYCESLYSIKELGFFLDLSDSGISESEIENMHPIFEKARKSMIELEQGAISNPDEKRQVGHYWLRNAETAPTPNLRKQIEETITQIKSFSGNILSGHIASPAGKSYTDMLLIGIGGSALGPQFVAEAMDNNTGLRPHFLDNTDPDGFDRTLSILLPNLERTLVIVISKSGGTAETRNGMLETQKIFKQNHLIFANQAVAITGENSQLYNQAQQEAWLSIFPMWDWVGGRTSVMSAVGLLPMALMGIEIQAFLSGAKIMDEHTRNVQLAHNPAGLLASAWFIIGEGKGKKDMVILPYKDRLLLFSRYLQQLIMESLGKSLDLDDNLVEQGIAVYGNKGSTDQHAYVQQLRDGLDNFFVTFIEVLKDRTGDSMTVDGQNTSGDYLFGFLKGTQKALQEKDRRSLSITIESLAPQSIGALIALYERAVGYYASFININAYHQPGVEAGKKAAGDVLRLKNQIIELLSDSPQSLSMEEIVDRLDLPGQEKLVYQILRHATANASFKIEGSFYDPISLRIGLHQ
ncbi:MAG: glucose-6-phosphate isomerase [Candidatus Marinimicrobia bacterium]|nr:glucose-6-phosphate isomerase [Candidatus Neomarinimicrobiota bacterium]